MHPSSIAGAFLLLLSALVLLSGWARSARPPPDQGGMIDRLAAEGTYPESGP